MDALIASYGGTDSDSDDDDASDHPHVPEPAQTTPIPPPHPSPLPPPPLSLIYPPNSLGALDLPLQSNHSSRIRSFPHVEGNYALHIYIPISIPLASRKEISRFLKRGASAVPELHVVEVDISLSNLTNDEHKFDQVVLGREFHVSLGRTVPIRVHQRDSIVAMLRQRLQSRRRYWIDFSKWEVFVNDERTRTFLSMEVTAGGMAEIRKQIEAVNEVYKLHNLPEFYKDPRPHISIAWAAGDTSDSLKRVIAEETRRRTAGDSLQNRLFTCKFGGITCKIGNKTYEICKAQDD